MDSRLSHRVAHRRCLRAGPWVSRACGLVLGLGVLMQGCSDNNGRVSPTFPAGQTGKTALAIFPKNVSISGVSDAGTCKEHVKFLATGGEQPYTFTTAFSAGAVLGRSSIDSSGFYQAVVESGASLSDTVLVIDAIGTQATATVSILCDVAAPGAPPAPGP